MGKHYGYLLSFTQLFGPHKGTSILCPGLTTFVKLWFFRISWWLSRNADFWAPSSRSIRSMYSSGKANFAPNHPTVSIAKQDNGLCSLGNPIWVNGDWVLYFTRHPRNSSSGSTRPYDFRVLYWVFCVHTTNKGMKWGCVEDTPTLNCKNEVTVSLPLTSHQ